MKRTLLIIAMLLSAVIPASASFVDNPTSMSELVDSVSGDTLSYLDNYLGVGAWVASATAGFAATHSGTASVTLFANDSFNGSDDIAGVYLIVANNAVGGFVADVTDTRVEFLVGGNNLDGELIVLRASGTALFTVATDTTAIITMGTASESVSFANYGPFTNYGELTVGEAEDGYDVTFHTYAVNSKFFWDESKHSLSLGSSTTASGDHSFAMGVSTTANALHAFAMGSSAVASGQNSVAFGSGVTASGNYSFADGHTVTASGDYSVAMGEFLQAGPADYTFVLGSGVDVSNRLTNNTASSLIVGFATTTPIFTVDSTTVTMSSVMIVPMDTSAPTGASGSIYFNTAEQTYYGWNGSEGWVAFH